MTFLRKQITTELQMHKQRNTSFVRVKIICVIQDMRGNTVLINYMTERHT